MDRQRIDAVVQAVADRLDGEWLLVNGSLVALWIDARRTTEDVDLVPVRGPKDARMALLCLAADLGLPVEALNSAADFFVERIPKWADEIAVLRKGRRGTVHRPSPTLFLLLKIRLNMVAGMALQMAGGAWRRPSIWFFLACAWVLGCWTLLPTTRRVRELLRKYPDLWIARQMRGRGKRR